MPFIGYSNIGHQLNRLIIVALLGGIGMLTWLAVDHDRSDASFQAKLKFAERDAHRVVELAEREGIPQNGARELLVLDPFSRGPRLFSRQCSGCHRIDGHDGKGQLILDPILDANGKQMTDKNGQLLMQQEPATAADLHHFGTREWVRQVLTDYDSTFAPLKNAGEKGQRFLDGEMADWCRENKATLLDAANKESLDALVEFLVLQGGRTDLGGIDVNRVALGREIFTGGALKSGTLSASCTDCHTIKPLAETELLGNASGPTLTGYAGRDWLKSFLRKPGHADFYGENNIMPEFDVGRLPDDELDLLVRWMTGDYYRDE
jgi:ubiquinol-cytochrome c reductase cytochrome b subunit